LAKANSQRGHKAAADAAALNENDDDNDAFPVASSSLLLGIHWV